MNSDGIMGYEVTIGIPVYNVERYIRRAMESALAQTFQSIEFLICDDCGTDGSMDIVREYQSNHPRGADIRIVSQPYNKGLGEARNLMIDSAAGKYLCFLDADDAMTEDAVSLLYESLISHHADIVYGSHERIEDFDGQRQVYPFIYPSLSFHIENEFATWAYETYRRMGTTTWNFLIDINIYRKNSIRYKPINFWEDMTTTIDLPTYVSRVVLLPNITYRYYCHYGSLSNFQKRDVLSLVRQFDRIVTLTQGDACHWNSPRVAVIPNPLMIDTPVGFVQREKKVIAVGSLLLVKGFDMLLEAWKKICDSHPDWQLEITGEGVEKPYLRQQMQSLSRVQIIPRTTDIASRYMSGEIFAMTSRYEGFGLVLLEAMSCGLAPVAFDCDFGPREIITDGHDGFMVPLGDIDMFAERLSFLMEHEDIRRQMRANAIEKSKHYLPQEIMPRFQQLYESLVEGGL